MLSPEARPLLVHRGLLHRGPDHLLETATPLLLAALEHGQDVAVVGERWFSRRVREVVGARAATCATTTYLPPSSVAARDTGAFAQQLRALVNPPRRLFVLNRYEHVSAPDHADLDILLATLPITLLCTCAHDHQECAAFRGAHHLVRRLRETPALEHARGDEAPQSAVTALDATFTHTRHLSGLRGRLRPALERADFAEPAGQRAVQAVHEACALACHLVESSVEASHLDPWTLARQPCELHVRAAEGRLVADVLLPRRARFPPRMLDTDPLRMVRAFASEASWSGTLRTRRLHLVV